MEQDYKQIYEQHVLPVMQEVASLYESNKVAEHNDYVAKYPKASPMDVIRLVNSTGVWSRKTSEDFYDDVLAELQHRGVVVDAVIEKQILDKMIEDRTPKNMLDKVTQYWERKPLLGKFFMGKDIVESPLDEYIHQRIEANSGIVNAATIGVEGTMFALTTRTVAGSAALPILAVDLTDVGIGMVYANGAREEAANKFAVQQYEKLLSEANDANTINIEVPLSVKEEILGTEDYSSYDNQEIKSAIETASTIAGNYANLINSAIQSGERTVKFDDGQEITLYDAIIRSRQYAQFSNELSKHYLMNLVSEVPSWMLQYTGNKELNAASDEELSSALYKVEKNGAYFEGLFDKYANQGVTNVKLGDQNYDVAEFALKAKQYYIFAEQIKSQQLENEDRKRESAITLNMGDKEQNPQKVVSETETPASAGVADKEQQNLSSQDQSSNKNIQMSQTALYEQQAAQSGWLSETSEGLKDFFKNPGEVLSSLPDVLMNMFQGKNGMGINMKTLLPVGLMFLAFNTRMSPLLKLMLVGGSLASLTGTISHEAKASESNARNWVGSQSPSRPAYGFKQYADEALDSRIENPRIVNGYFMAKINGVEGTARLTPNQVAAVENGALPINTLANALLAHQESMRAAQIQAEQSYNQQVQQQRNIQQQVEQGQGIR